MKPIRFLTEPEIFLYVEHLKRLSADDRYLRFGTQATDYFIEQHVRNSDPRKRLVVGAFDHMKVVAAIEIQFDVNRQFITNDVAEVGLSVEDAHRGSGLGSELFRHAILSARIRGVSTMKSFCLSHNRWMNRIANRHGMKVHSEYGENEGTVTLEPARPVHYWTEFVSNSVAFSTQIWQMLFKR